MLTHIFRTNDLDGPPLAGMASEERLWDGPSTRRCRELVRFRLPLGPRSEKTRGQEIPSSRIIEIDARKLAASEIMCSASANTSFTCKSLAM